MNNKYDPTLWIDGRKIGYNLTTGIDYLRAKDYTEEEIDKIIEDENDKYEILNQIMGLKHACVLLRHTAYLCGSLSEGLYGLKFRLISELRDEYNFEFDDDFVENY